jgi:6-phosphofructokinase 1
MGITPVARRYLSPLIEGEDYPPYDRDGLPKYVRMSKVLAQKKLPEFKI